MYRLTDEDLPTVLRQLPKASIPRDLIKAIMKETVHRKTWWESETFRLRWMPAVLGLATALGVLWLSKIQRHHDVRAILPLTANPAFHPETLHAFLPYFDDKKSLQEKGERRENKKS